MGDEERRDSMEATPSPTEVTHEAPNDNENNGVSPSEKERKIEEVIRSNDEDEGYPEGGLRAWSVVAGTWAMMAFSFGYLNSFGVLQEFYSRDYLKEYSQSDIAWIGAVQYFFIFFMGLFAGRAFDLGLMRVFLAFAILLFSFSQMMLSLSTKYYQIFLSEGIALGIAFGLLFNLSVSAPTHWFKRRRATAMGVQASGSSMGGVLFPIVVRRLIDEIGFPWTMRFIGFLGLFCLGLSWFLMKTRLPPLVSYRNGGWRQVQWVDLSAFKMGSYTAFVIGSTLILFGLYTPFTYLDIFTRTYNIPADGYWLSILNAASIFGRIIPGLIADKVGRINTIVPHTIVATIFLFVFPLFTNADRGAIYKLSMIAFTLIFGYCSGCYVSLIPACVAQLGPIHNVGTRLGMLFAVSSIGGLLGTPISGFILGDSQPYNWWGALGYSGAVVCVGVACLALSRMLAVNWKWRAKI